MYYSQLSVLKEIITTEQLERLNDYFANLHGGAIKNITVSKVANAISCSSEISIKILTECQKLNIVDVSYGIRCPECNHLIKRIDSLSEIPQNINNCYNCGADIEITSSDIEVLFKLSNQTSFKCGQQEISNTKLSAEPVAHEDTLKNIILAGGINPMLFAPSEEEYQHLLKLYTTIFEKKDTTKEAGDSLESLTTYLFNLCNVFSTAGIKTSTNQIDCYVRNKVFLNYGFFRIIGDRIFIECKNEVKVPSGGYLSKLHSIIRLTNGKNKVIQLGIIVSKKKGPSTFKTLATKVYLSDDIVMINICGEDIKSLIDNKGNLLDMLERKIDEVILDATSDLKDAGLYNS